VRLGAEVPVTSWLSDTLRHFGLSKLFVYKPNSVCLQWCLVEINLAGSRLRLALRHAPCAQRLPTAFSPRGPPLACHIQLAPVCKVQKCLSPVALVPGAPVLSTNRKAKIVTLREDVLKFPETSLPTLSEVPRGH
jgi:hypothetical protein